MPSAGFEPADLRLDRAASGIGSQITHLYIILQGWRFNIFTLLEKSCSELCPLSGPTRALVCLALFHTYDGYCC
jgi:hypothetical protein